MSNLISFVPPHSYQDDPAATTIHAIIVDSSCGNRNNGTKSKRYMRNESENCVEV